ncbi:MAG: hypothetical protein M1831_006918 [Alyxoria varia]|nr:MAG: hypothetical protein M1831_006918 [Alyxoria varia]
MAPRNRPADLESSVQRLSVNDGVRNPKTQSTKPRKEKLADSWEDESTPSSDEDIPASNVQNGDGSLKSPKTPTTQGSDYPGPPPPTPASPRFTSHSRGLSKNVPVEGYSNIDFEQDGTGRSSSRPSTSSNARPEKTTATASRMIAAGLGVKAPKRTEEERKYDRAVRDNERRRREEAKVAERLERERIERCKKDMWGDD